MCWKREGGREMREMGGERRRGRLERVNGRERHQGRSAVTVQGALSLCGGSSQVGICVSGARSNAAYPPPFDDQPYSHTVSSKQTKMVSFVVEVMPPYSNR
jgi:hypothetical protein